MGRTGHGVFIHTNRGYEKSGNKIVFLGPAGQDQSPGRKPAYCRKVGRKSLKNPSSAISTSQSNLLLPRYKMSD